MNKGSILIKSFGCRCNKTFEYNENEIQNEVQINCEFLYNKHEIYLNYFNIDNYIGDPRLASLPSYPNLTSLRNFYFQKYSSSQMTINLH